MSHSFPHPLAWVRIGALLLLLLPLRLAWGAEPEVHLAQARIYLKREWYGEAALELRAAVATPAGRARHDICWLAAGVAWEILDIDWALEMAEAAAAAAPDEARRQEALALVRSYREAFGFLTVQAPHPGMVSRLQLESTGILLDPERKRYVQRAALAWREQVALPARLGLPVGTYTVNGHAVTVEAGQEAQLPLPMAALGPRGLMALQVTRIEAAVGIRTPMAGGQPAAASAGLLPSLHSQLTLSQPVGPVLLGVSVAYTSQDYLGVGNAAAREGGWSGMARLGREVALDRALSMRPSLLLGGGRAPGIGLRCDPDAGTCVALGSDGDGAGAADRFVTSPAWLAGGELLLEHREAGRTTALGTGVKLIATRAWGRLPAQLDGGALSIPDAGRAWTAADLALLAHLSLAL